MTHGNLREYSIFITNLCAISRFLLEKAPDLYPDVRGYVKSQMESGDALLNFILKGPSIIPPGRLHSLWSTEDPKVSANEPDSAEQQPAASYSVTPMAQQPATIARPEGIEGQSTYLDHPPQAPSITQAAPAGTSQRPVLTGSAPANQQTGQQPLQWQASGSAPPRQDVAGLNFTSYGQQPPLASTTGPASALVRPNSQPTSHVASAVQLGQAPQCTSDAVHQSSSAVPPFPTPAPLQAPRNSHPNVNPGIQPGIPQSLQMHATHQPQPTPLNFAPIQSQVPAVHPASTQGHAGQSGSQGWPVGGLSQLPSQITQVQPGPVVSHSSVPPTAAPPGQQWTTNLVGPAQMPGQVTTSAQQGNAMVPTQSLPQIQAAYSQPGSLNMLAQPPAAQSQASTAPNPFWAGQSQENMSENDFLLGDLPSVFQ